MHEHDLKTRLGEAARAPEAWAGTSELDAHAAAGCSLCARTLVNARETAVDLAASEAPVKPAEGTRSAVLERARAVVAARRPPGAAAPPPAPEPRRRVLDPSAAVAHGHITHASEPERIREVDRLDATVCAPGDGSERLLGQLARFVDFPLFFISIMRGERVSYRAQRGLPESLVAFRDLRREMSYCTHCVSAEAPLLIENAFMEAFFRGNKAAMRFGIAAYAGVPLRTSAGIVVGTLCALDFKPRSIAPETVALLEVFAWRAVAEIERDRGLSRGGRERPQPAASDRRSPALLAAVLEATSGSAGACNDVGTDVYAGDFFRELICAEHATGRPSALLCLRAPSAAALLGWIDEHETAGRLGPDAFALLLPGAGAEAAAQRLGRLRSAAGPIAAGVALLSRTDRPEEWIERALREAVI